MKRFTHIILFCSVTIYSTFAISSETDTVQEDLYQSLIGLFFDATRIGNGEVINEFLDAGFPINQRNYQSYTVNCCWQGVPMLVYRIREAILR